MNTVSETLLSANPMRIGGITPLTTIDFPGRLAAVVYCQGCPWRCSYCHNPELLDATAPAAVPWPQVLAFLQSRRGLLDGVVFSGGEPTLQAALPAALAEVRAMGFATGLHTGGMYPERLAAVLPLLDWVGLDVKGPAACLRRHHRRSRQRKACVGVAATRGAKRCAIRMPDYLEPCAV